MALLDDALSFSCPSSNQQRPLAFIFHMSRPTPVCFLFFPQWCIGSWTVLLEVPWCVKSIFRRLVPFSRRDIRQGITISTWRCLSFGREIANLLANKNGNQGLLEPWKKSLFGHSFFGVHCVFLRISCVCVPEIKN